MPTYGYTIGDADNTSTGTVGLEIRRFIIPEEPGGAIVSELVGTLTGAVFTGDSGEDLEGLGTNPITQRISAISEGPGLGRRVNNIDRSFAPATQNLTGTSRLDSDTGADFYVNSSQTAILYDLQAEPTDPGNKTILYPINGTTIGAAEGSSPEFADGLAIYSFKNPTTGAFTGRYYAFASDFHSDDGDNAELYKVNLNPAAGDPLLSPIQLRNPNGTAFVVPTTGDADTPLDGFDSGLAFTRDGNRLIALFENGALYEIYNFLDDAYAGANTFGAAVQVGDGFATIRKLGDVSLPGTSTGAIEYEGLAIVSETVAGANVFTGA